MKRRRLLIVLSAVFVLLALASLGAQSYYAFAEDCIGRDFGNPGNLSKYCNKNPAYDYDNVAGDWFLITTGFGTASVACIVTIGIVLLRNRSAFTSR